MKAEATKKMVWSDGECENYTIWTPKAGCDRCLAEAQGRPEFLLERALFHQRLIAFMENQDQLLHWFYRHWRTVHMEYDFTRDTWNPMPRTDIEYYSC